MSLGICTVDEDESLLVMLVYLFYLLAYQLVGLLQVYRMVYIMVLEYFIRFFIYQDQSYMSYLSKYFRLPTLFTQVTWFLHIKSQVESLKISWQSLLLNQNIVTFAFLQYFITNICIIDYGVSRKRSFYFWIICQLHILDYYYSFCTFSCFL